MRPPSARALALGVALVLTKLLVLGLRASDGIAPPLAFASPIVLTYQDAWVVLGFLGCDLLLQRLTHTSRRAARIALTVGLLLVVYSALNIPVTRLFSTPLTASMLAAVGGALSDSVSDQMTPANVLAMLTPPLVYLVLALRSPRAPPPTRSRKAPPPRRLTSARVALALTFVCALTGPFLLSQVATLGVHRNALIGLVQTAIPSHPSTEATSSEHAADAADLALPDHGPTLDLRHLTGAAKGRNVLVIVLESHGARHLRAFNPKLPDDPTPHLTRLLERAVLFDRITTPYPESIKGLFAYLCSQTPLPNADAARHAAKLHRAACLPATLNAAGYATGLFHSGHFAYLGMRDVIAERGFDTTLDALDIKGPFMSSFGTDDRETARRVLRWVDALPLGKPFFAAFLPIAGHHPYHAPGDAPRPFPQATEADAYRNDLFVGDVATGLLIEGLRTRGLLDDTLIVVFGDHGQAFQEHPGNFAHTLFLYEENLHVPFALVLPRNPLTTPLHAPQRGSLRDLAPTVLALLGLAPDPLHEGHSLLEPRSPPVVSFTDHRALQFAVHASDAAGDWKLVLDRDANRPELYDLTKDPGEQHDLAAREPKVTTRLTRFLTAWHAMHYRRFLALDAPASDSAPTPHQ